MGDLVLTCTGDLSRNRRVGMGLGRGHGRDPMNTRRGGVCVAAALSLRRKVVGSPATGALGGSSLPRAAPGMAPALMRYPP